jgi:hypothetical protein
VALLNKRVESVKSLSFKSSFTPLLVRLVQLMPASMWVDKISVLSRDDSRLLNGANDTNDVVIPETTRLTVDDYYTVSSSKTLVLQGVVSLEDPNSEFDLVNQFLETVRQDPQIKKDFSVVKLNSLDGNISIKGKKVTKFTFEFK